jgi:aspartokinase/homoserine dehydrogenase 1
MEAREIFVENILPDYCLEAETKEELTLALKKADAHFEDLRQNAEHSQKRLRMIAKLQYGKASIRLQAVDRNSPFFHLNGSDNMLVFTTKRYKDRPLVIQGPGAGAEVTAAGVFAELIHIGNLL